MRVRSRGFRSTGEMEEEEGYLRGNQCFGVLLPVGLKSLVFPPWCARASSSESSHEPFPARSITFQVPHDQGEGAIRKRALSACAAPVSPEIIASAWPRARSPGTASHGVDRVCRVRQTRCHRPGCWFLFRGRDSVHASSSHANLIRHVCYPADTVLIQRGGSSWPKL